jgi:hypothetical protein
LLPVAETLFDGLVLIARNSVEHRPLMNIYFSPCRENELHEVMKRQAIAPWASQTVNPFGKVPEEGRFYFHRDAVGDDPSCILCIHRKQPGHWIVPAIIPDEGQEQNPIPFDQYKTILSEFDAQIAEPAANAVQGMAALEISMFRLEDYFSPRSVELLKRFCTTSNQSDLGMHQSDQEKWIEFLLSAYDERKDIHCDIFGGCLKNADWWPESGVSKLINEYDFAMRLLKQSVR